MEVQPLRDSIFFTFVQVTRDGFFKNETSWGFEIAGTDYDASKHRWGLVEQVGPDVTKVSVGDYVLIEQLKWTTALRVNGEKLWRTAEPHIILKSDTRPTDIL